MSKRFAGFAALVTLLMGVATIGAAVGASQPAIAAGVPAPPIAVDTWAWCGVNPDDAVAADAVRAMAQVGGIDATFGPCNIPSAGYSPAFTANRYVSADVYMRLVQLNASVGMKTIVYDARLWAADASVRTTAINFWLPVISHIAAWDMGDEFDPAGAEWSILVQRWGIVRSDAEVRTGVKPFTNTLPFSSALDKTLTDLPGSETLLSFAVYGGDRGASIARAYDARARLMCAVDELDHAGFVTTPASIRTDMEALKAAGCDQLLVFGGYPVFDDPSAMFGTSSVVDRSGAPTERAAATQEGSGHSSLTAVPPVRLLETRSGPGLSTVDSRFNGVGIRPADSVLRLPIVGRAGVPSWADSVVLNVTVTEPGGPGYLTVYPCGQTRPTSSNLNYDVGSTRAVAVIAELGGGAVCVYTQTPTQVIVDLTGFYPLGSSFSGVQPARLLDTRIGPEFTTIDGLSVGAGRPAAGVITAVQVTSRGGVPADASSVAVNVTAVGPGLGGFLTVFPCGEPLPLASTLNFLPGAIVANSALVKVGANGSICVFSNVDTDVIIDVNGYEAAQTVVRVFDPTRMLETRPGLTTADGLAQLSSMRPDDAVLELQIGDRLGVPSAIRAVVLNLTVTEATAPGFVTVYPCGGGRPVASTLNYVPGTTVANLAIATTSIDGKVCIYTQTATHLVVDVSAYHT